MTERRIVHRTADEVPRVSQKLKLVCSQCGKRADYDVGAIFCDLEGEGDSAKKYYGFGNYFRCKNCRSGGPWEIADYLKMLALAVRANADPNFDGFRIARCELFDGTIIQAPAQGEDHLLQLIKKSPRSGFLCTRLGNLLRSCGEQPKATEWYAKALDLDPGDTEARHHLVCFAMDDADVPSALVHAPLLVRYLLEGRRIGDEELDEGIAFAVVERLRTAPGPFRQHFLAHERTA